MSVAVMVVIAKRHPTMTHNTPDATQPTLVIGITQTALQTAGLSSSGSTSQTATAPSAQNSRGGFGNEPSPGSEPGSSGQPEQGGQAPGQVGNPSGLSAGEPNANATANAQTQTPSGASDPQSGSSGEPGQTPGQQGGEPGQTPGEPSEPGQQAGEPGQTPTPSGASEPQQAQTSEPQQALPDASDLEAEIGPRGQTKVTSENRGAVRKWLTRKGVAYNPEGACKGAGKLSVSELSAAYNDTTDQTLRDLLAQQGGQTSPQTNGANQPQTPSGQPEPKQAQTPQTPKAQTPTPSGLPEPLPKPVKVPSNIRKHALHDECVDLLTPGGFGVFVFGPAGSGKTTLAQTVAQTLGLDCYIAGAVQKDFKVLGYKDARGEYQTTPFRQAFEHGGLFLFDEIDASNPQVLLVLNAALANGICDFPDRTVKAHPRFRFIASANTNGGGATAQYSGRNKLDAASLDRFAVLECDYDDALTDSVVRSYGLTGAVLEEALEWVATVRDYRLAARQNSVDLVLSPRAAFFGVRVLAAGGKQFRKCKDLLDCFILKKVSDPEARKRLAKFGEAAVNARRNPAQPTA
jgi:hypothetical protein